MAKAMLLIGVCAGVLMAATAEGHTETCFHACFMKKMRKCPERHRRCINSRSHGGLPRPLRAARGSAPQGAGARATIAACAPQPVDDRDPKKIQSRQPLGGRLRQRLYLGRQQCAARQDHPPRRDRRAEPRAAGCDVSARPALSSPARSGTFFVTMSPTAIRAFASPPHQGDLRLSGELKPASRGKARQTGADCVSVAASGRGLRAPAGRPKEARDMMILRTSAASPFGRKVPSAALAGLSGAIEILDTDTADPDGALAKLNPLGRFPALTLASGATYFRQSRDRRISRPSRRAAP